MIFATVGTQLPFPRFIDCLDELAGRLGLEIFAQTADPGAKPAALQAKAFLHPDEFADKIAACSLIAGHAGIGTILEAKRAGKPLILFPRRADRGEHRNDHQAATARFVGAMRGIHVAWDAAELEALLTAGELEPAGPEPGPAAEALVAAVSAQLAAWRGQG